MSNPDNPGESQVEHVVVHESSRSADIPVIRSLLESADIPFIMEGKDLMNLFPSEFLGTMIDPHAAVRFKVPIDRAEEAQALLQEDPTLDSPPEELA